MRANIKLAKWKMNREVCTLCVRHFFVVDVRFQVSNN